MLEFAGEKKVTLAVLVPAGQTLSAPAGLAASADEMGTTTMPVRTAAATIVVHLFLDFTRTLTSGPLT